MKIEFLDHETIWEVADEFREQADLSGLNNCNLLIDARKF
mgnify:CR=1 FL=1